MPNRLRTASRASSSVVQMFCPKTVTDPLSGMYVPIRCRSSVLLPQPLPPMITSISPG